MCTKDHLEKCYTCRELEAEALIDSIHRKDLESLQKDLDLEIESAIAQETNNSILSDYRALKEYENSFPLAPGETFDPTDTTNSCPLDDPNLLQVLLRSPPAEPFIGRGPHSITHAPEIEKCILSQFDIWANPTKISVIIPECMALFDCIANAGDAYKISYLLHDAIRAVQTNIPYRAKTYKGALMEELGGSGPQRNPSGTKINHASKTQLISVTLHNLTVTYSVQRSSHKSRGSVVLIDGWSQCKCSTSKQ